MSVKRRKDDQFGLDQGVFQLLDGLARLLFFGGLILLVGAAAMLVFNYASGQGADAKQVQNNINLFAGPAFYGGIACGLGALFMFWGEEVLGVLLLLGAALLIFSPYYLPLIIPGNPTEGPEILSALNKAGAGIGALGLFALVWDIVSRIRLSVTQGMKADTLKYGKGLREEQDIRNVFLGRCWQLPYCRKFVRERCPIYHARRTCWKERVGCMCEEQVIRNAMEGKVIPKDMVAAAKFIPYNSRLTPQQKAERCRQCVIYNEHQKHKYKALLPISMVACAGAYFLFREPVATMMNGLVAGVNRTINQATLGRGSLGEAPMLGGISLTEVLVVIGFFILFAYSIRLIEFLIFKVKV